MRVPSRDQHGVRMKWLSASNVSRLSSSDFSSSSRLFVPGRLATYSRCVPSCERLRTSGFIPVALTGCASPLSRPTRASKGSDQARVLSFLIVNASLLPSGDRARSVSLKPVVRRSGPPTQRNVCGSTVTF
jgi:hypothetical protein